MGKSFGTALALASALFATAAFAQMQNVALTQGAAAMQSGRVMSVDRLGNTFVVRLGSGDTNFKVTPQTVYQAGTAPTSFAAVKAWSEVEISGHSDGKNMIADRVAVMN